MRLEILTPETKVFDGEVSSVTFPGVDGLFQVLNGHAPLMSLLRGGTVEYRAGGALLQLKNTFMKSSNKLTHSSILLGLIALLYGAETKAQFNEGDKLLNVGAGVAATYGGVPLFLTYEQQAFHRNISVGGATGYQSWTQDYALIGSKGSIDYTSYLLGIRASYHLNEALNVKVEELDLYLGLGL